MHQSSGPAERGSALVVVLLLSMIAAAIGGTLSVMSNADHRMAANERDSERALQASRAGLSYGYYMFDSGLLAPSVDGEPFNSFSTATDVALEQAEFTGALFDMSGVLGQGQLYRISSTGTYNNSSRTTEIVFQIVPESFKFGYIAFSEATLHNHSNLAGPWFEIRSTILSNGKVEVPDNLTIDGAIVSSDTVTIATGATLTKGVYAHAVTNNGTIQGDVRLLTSVLELDPSAGTYNRIDAYGNKYNWYNGNSTPGSLGGGGTELGSVSSYTVANGDIFETNIFNRNGYMLSNPDVNVTRYAAPPMLDYAAMKAEADLNDPTYFTSTDDAVTYLISKKVNETIEGRAVTTVRVGTPTAPEFLYIDGDFQLTVDPNGSDDPGGAEIQADAVYIEGGIYISGNFDYEGPNFVDPSPNPAYPLPPKYYMLSINALPYCYPALVAYEQPSSGSVATWTPEDTPLMGGGSTIGMSAGGDEGPSYFNGLVLAQNDIHLHHTKDPKEIIKFNGAQLGWSLHNCDFFQFTYDPMIRCTRFLLTDDGDAEIVYFREVR